MSAGRGHARTGDRGQPLPGGQNLRLGRPRRAAARPVVAGGVFAVERGNNDLVLFVLAVIAATLACRTPGLRLVGYGAALLAGSTLILACFFTAQNIGYRVTHLVLVLPALTALWRLDRHFAWPLATGAAIALLWSQGWGDVPRETWTSTAKGLGIWLVRETLWWGLITLLIALTVSLSANSTMGRIVLRRVPV